MNLERFLDNELKKDTLRVEIKNVDGSIHKDSNYHDYEVVEVKYRSHAYLKVKKKIK